MKFSGKNFQAWPSFDLDLNGFVVVVGPSFAGKSSIFRALKGIVRNDISEQRVRNGSEQLELTLTVDGKTIKAIRKANGTTKYLTEKGDYTSLAKGIPDALKELNAGVVKIGEYTVDPIFASQFGEQFLLESTGPTELNTILGAFASTEKLEYGKKQANLLITQKNSEAKTLSEQIGDAEERRENLSKVFDKGKLVETSLKTIEPKVRSLEALRLWLGELTTTKARLVPLQHLAESLAIPDTTEAEQLQEQILQLHIAAKAQYRSARLLAMDTELEDAIDRWNSIVTLSRNAKAVNETVSLKSRLEMLYAQGAAKKLNNIVGAMESLWTASIALQDSIKYTGQATLLIQRVADKKAELATINREIMELQVTHHLCPKCGKPLEHLCGS